MKEKMREQLRAAIANDHTHIVLWAFGCRAFAPTGSQVAKKAYSKQVATWYKEVIDDDEFKGKIHVVFAIINDHNGSDNIDAFRDGLGLTEGGR